ncbi:MAG: hypothetical protein R2709_01505 [Marmoricola sp.]
MDYDRAEPLSEQLFAHGPRKLRIRIIDVIVSRIVAVRLWLLRS